VYWFKLALEHPLRFLVLIFKKNPKTKQTPFIFQILLLSPAPHKFIFLFLSSQPSLFYTVKHTNVAPRVLIFSFRLIQSFLFESGEAQRHIKERNRFAKTKTKTNEQNQKIQKQKIEKSKTKTNKQLVLIFFIQR